MSHRPTVLARYLLLALAALVLQSGSVRAQIGPFLSGEGPVNRSMGGASVAAPLDSLGATYWNPATTSALPNSMDLGVELLYVQSRLASSVPANSLAPGFPPVTLSGESRGDNGFNPLPSLGLVYRPDGSRWTFGLGVFAAAGFGVDYPASSTNAILTPPPPNGVGVGALYSNLQVLQIAPTLAYQLTDRLSIGAGPTVNLALLQADPLFITGFNANGSYPPGAHSHVTWGGGFQMGVYYVLDGGWRLGASAKSPQWFEPFHFNSVDSGGQPRYVRFRADLPMIPSVGVAYAGIDRLLLAADFRYFDYGNANGLRQTGFDATGAARGLGWHSIFAMALGAQYQVTDAISLRMGYTFNQDPIPDSQSSINIASPTIAEHVVYAGASYNVSQTLKLSLGYAHAFQNSITGPYVTPFGAVPGSSVRNTLWADTLMVGASVRY